MRLFKHCMDCVLKYQHVIGNAWWTLCLLQLIYSCSECSHFSNLSISSFKWGSSNGFRLSVSLSGGADMSAPADSRTGNQMRSFKYLLKCFTATRSSRFTTTMLRNISLPYDSQPHQSQPRETAHVVQCLAQGNFSRAEHRDQEKNPVPLLGVSLQHETRPVC